MINYVITSLLDNAPNYLAGCVTPKRYYIVTGVNISQKNRNYSVWEGNETYKISKTFPKFKKKIGIIPTTFVLI